MATVKSMLRQIMGAVVEWPVIRILAKPVQRRRFLRHRVGNAYWGEYANFDEARAAIPPSMTASYDIEAAAGLYTDRLSRLEASDYPPLFWLARLLERGQRRVVDLGGHVGVSYYAFGQHLDFPPDLAWQVHDVPAVMARGRELAAQRGVESRLHFVELDAVDGCDVLMAKGALQYLGYSLAELLGGLRTKPNHLLVNLTPLHSSRTFFTVQNIGITLCPYRVEALPNFLAGIAALGYVLEDRWDHPERSLRVPFHPDLAVDRYHGFCFRRA
jgi:putative methyltransferase (TIGR04325 family)